MATIIQPYNDWRKNLAVSFLAPIVGNMIQRSQEANQNRKINALLSKSMEDLGAGGSQSLMSSPVMPEGYNDNGWVQAFHKVGTPLTQFDMGTSALAPIVAPQQQNFNQQDFRRAIMNNLATKRFSMVNPALVEQYLDPFYKSMEQERLNNMRQKAADAITNAQDDKARRNAIYAGIINGSVPESLMSAENDMYKYNNLSAAQQADVDYRDKQFNEGIRQFDERLAQQDRQFGANLGLSYAQMQQNQNQFDATRNDNNYWRGVEQGNYEKSTAQTQANWEKQFGVEREDANRNYGLQERQLTTAEQANRSAMLKQLYDAYTARLQELNDEYQNLDDPTRREQYENEIARVRGLLEQIVAEMNSVYSPIIKNTSFTSPVQSNNNFYGAMDVVFGNEGGYVNDPYDRGGTTNMGITSQTFAEAKRRGLTSANNVSDLSREEANNIYNKMYWEPSNADKLPEDIAVPYFDSVVHHGVQGSAKLLQRAINTFAGRNIVVEDGIVGEQTINALNSLIPDSASRNAFISTMLDVRDNQFDSIVNRDPSQKKFLNGWKNRTNRLRSRNSNTALLLRDKAVSKQTDNSPKIWVRTDGDYITENQFNEMLRSGKTQHEIEKELERNGFTRAKRNLTPEQDMRPNYMKGNINLSSIYSPITGIR